MGESPKKENVSKIYCEKCNEVFDSKTKYEKHLSRHDSTISCESCPIDVALQKLVNLFRRAK